MSFSRWSSPTKQPQTGPVNPTWTQTSLQISYSISPLPSFQWSWLITIRKMTLSESPKEPKWTSLLLGILCTATVRRLRNVSSVVPAWPTSFISLLKVNMEKNTSVLNWQEILSKPRAMSLKIAQVSLLAGKILHQWYLSIKKSNKDLSSRMPQLLPVDLSLVSLGKTRQSMPRNNLSAKMFSMNV